MPAPALPSHTAASRAALSVRALGSLGCARHAEAAARWAHHGGCVTIITGNWKTLLGPEYKYSAEPVEKGKATEERLAHEAKMLGRNPFKGHGEPHAPRRPPARPIVPAHPPMPPSRTSPGNGHRIASLR